MAITLNKTRIYGITHEDVDYIRLNYRKTAASLAAELGINYRRVSEVISVLQLREAYTATKIPRNHLEEYEKDLNDPCNTHARLGYKWNVTPEAIAKARKSRGLGHWRTNNNTVLEIKVQELLDVLNIVYHTNKRIHLYTIDLYLGHNICIDIHGEWAHSKPHVIERDKRKTEWLASNNYHYLVIHEQELKDVESLQKCLSNFYWASLCGNVQKITL